MKKLISNQQTSCKVENLLRFKFLTNCFNLIACKLAQIFKAKQQTSNQPFPKISSMVLRNVLEVFDLIIVAPIYLDPTKNRK